MSIFNSLEGDLLSKLAKQTPLSTIYRKYSESLIIINSFWQVNQVVSTRFTKIKKYQTLMEHNTETDLGPEPPQHLRWRAL